MTEQSKLKYPPGVNPIIWEAQQEHDTESKQFMKIQDKLQHQYDDATVNTENQTQNQTQNQNQNSQTNNNTTNNQNQTDSAKNQQSNTQQPPPTAGS